MAVRRLHAEQPDRFAFTPENAAWAERTVARYPEGRQASAVIPLLFRAQEQEGWVSEPCIQTVADMLDMPKIRVLEVATFYTMFHLSPVGRSAHVQVCGTTPCRLRGAGDLIEVCRRRIAEEQHHLSPDGSLSWEEVECLGACVNAPMVQVFKDTYEDLTPEAFETLLTAFERGDTPRPGPQNGRIASAPDGGPTTLLTLDFDAMEREFDARRTGQERGGAAPPQPDSSSPPVVADASADPGGGKPLSAVPVMAAADATPAREADPVAATEAARQEAGRPTATGRPDEEAARSRPTDKGGAGLASLPHKRSTTDRAADAAAASEGVAVDGELNDLSRAGREDAVGGGAPGFSPATAEPSEAAPTPAMAGEAAADAGTRPAGLSAPRADLPDDLTRIDGINRADEERLNALGFWHFDQIADWSAEAVRAIEGALSAPGRIERERWVDQAQTFAAGAAAKLATRSAEGDETLQTEPAPYDGKNP